MKKIVEYLTVTGSMDLGHFDKQINELLDKGFQPYGHPCIAGASSADADEHPQSDFLIAQAMVRYEE
jgi:hypothetical protein